MTRAQKENWRLSVLAPVYNEAPGIREFVAELADTLERIAPPGGCEIVLVNDGSTDASGTALDELAREYAGVVVAVHLARNFGMEAAIAAGLEIVTGDAVITLDADMQDDPGAFDAFLDKWREGFEVVYAVRTSRKEWVGQRALFWGFYRVLGWIANIDLPADAGNFALMDRAVVDALRLMPERNRFLRGLRAWVGFRQAGVPVPRRGRGKGRSRLGIRGQWKLAMNAIFAFSYVPLFVFRLAGMCALGLAAVLIVWALFYKLVVGIEVRAWASQFIATAFLSGINLLGIGVIGEYVARIHDEVKGRPNFVVHHISREPRE